GEWLAPRWLGSAVVSGSDAGAQFHSLRCYDVGTRTWAVLLDAEGCDRNAWPSPGGTRLAVVTRDDGTDQLAVYDVAGSAPSGAVGGALPPAGGVSGRRGPRRAPRSR